MMDRGESWWVGGKDSAGMGVMCMVDSGVEDGGQGVGRR